MVRLVFARLCIAVELHADLPPIGEVILLENLRFHVEEEGSVKDEQGNKVGNMHMLDAYGFVSHQSYL